MPRTGSNLPFFLFCIIYKFEMAYKLFATFVEKTNKQKTSSSEPRQAGSAHLSCVLCPESLAAFFWRPQSPGHWPLLARLSSCCFLVHYQLLKQQVPSGWSAGTGTSAGGQTRTELPGKITRWCQWKRRSNRNLKTLGKLCASNNFLREGKMLIKVTRRKKNCKLLTPGS